MSSVLELKSICLNEDGDEKVGNIHCRKNNNVAISHKTDTANPDLICVFIPKNLCCSSIKLDVEIYNTGENITGTLIAKEVSNQAVFGNFSSIKIEIKKGMTENIRLTFNSLRLLSMRNSTAKNTGKLKWSFVTEKDTIEICEINYCVYVIHNTPKKPWDCVKSPYDPANKNYVWTDLLDVCCELYKNYQTATTDTEKKHLAAFTHGLNESVVFNYDTALGASYYSIGQNVFKLQKFLIDNSGTVPKMLNCADCANIVSAMALSVGINCNMGIMANLGGFKCNPILAIGYKSVVKDWKSPFSGSFSYHQVAVFGDDSFSKDSVIYDACLNLDSGEYPALDYDPAKPAVKTPLLPCDYTFAETDDAIVNVNPGVPYKNSFYRERLARDKEMCSLYSSVYRVIAFTDILSLPKEWELSNINEYDKLIIEKFGLNEKTLPEYADYSFKGDYPVVDNHTIHNMSLTCDFGLEKEYLAKTSSDIANITVAKTENRKQTLALLIKKLSVIANPQLKRYDLGDIAFHIENGMIIFVKKNIITQITGNNCIKTAVALLEQINK